MDTQNQRQSQNITNETKNKYKELFEDILIDFLILYATVIGFGICISSIVMLCFGIYEAFKFEPLLSIIILFLIILGIYIVDCIRKNKIYIVNPIRYRQHIDENTSAV